MIPTECSAFGATFTPPFTVSPKMPEPIQPTSSRIGRVPRALLSVVLVLHLWALLAPPLAFQTQGPLGSSPSVATLARPMRGYGEFLYLNRGYAFFAPDPGPSHLIQAAYVDGQGRRVEEIYPDRKRHWPRLLYHRHFMLSEFLHEIYHPPGPPEELRRIDPDEAIRWSKARARYEQTRLSFVNHLASVRDGSQDMAIRRLEHRIPTFAEFLREQIPLDDQRLYGVLVDRPIEYVAPEVLPADESANNNDPVPAVTGDPADSDREEVAQ